MMTFIMSHRETESRKMEKKEGENEKRRKGERSLWRRESPSADPVRVSYV